MYILILLLFLFIITYEFRRTFFGGGLGGWERTELFFLKMYLVFY